MSNVPIRVAVVDQQPLFRHGICHAVTSSSQCELVAEGTVDSDAVEIAKKFTPEIMLIGINLPGCGVESLSAIATASQQIKVIILAAIASAEDLSASLRAGAQGYILKNVNAAQLVDIVRTVHAGAVYAEPTVASRLLLGRQDDATELMRSLSKRERDILALVTQSLTNVEIARCHNIAEKTVKHYMTSILQKLRARNRVEAALIAQRYMNSHALDNNGSKDALYCLPNQNGNDRLIASHAALRPSAGATPQDLLERKR